MKRFKHPSSTGVILALICFSGWAQPVLMIEDITLAPKPRLTIQSAVGTTNAIQFADELATHQWRILTNLVVTNNPYVFVDLTTPTSSQRFYRVSMTNVPPHTNVSSGMVLIPAGWFTMGDTVHTGIWDELPAHTVEVSAFYMDTNLVTQALWDEVYSWAIGQGCSFDSAGAGKALNHPVQGVSWYDVVKWCNARSEKEGRVPACYTSADQTMVYRAGRVDVHNDWVKWNSGYRLPTEAEWEYAARGGLSEKLFPWGDTIDQSQANYYSQWSEGQPYYFYDVNSTPGYHPNYAYNPEPFTSPVGSFAPNGYGLYDMAANVWEWCWDWEEGYLSDYQTDPRGPASGSAREHRGGCWHFNASYCRTANRSRSWPDHYDYDLGFRSVLPPGQR